MTLILIFGWWINLHNVTHLEPTGWNSEHCIVRFIDGDRRIVFRDTKCDVLAEKIAQEVGK